MSDLNIIPDGAVLIRDGVIEEVGTTRRVENLVPARLAKEIDAAGKIVMPAFVDPDIAIAAPAAGHRPGEDAECDISRMSRRRLESHAAIMIADLARYGILTIGAHTLSAPDLQNTLKALRLHQTMQAKPLRIRSIFAPPWYEEEDDHTEASSPTTRTTESGTLRQRIHETWMPSVFRKKLASLLEIPVSTARLEDAREMASAAAAAGYNIRFRISGPGSGNILELACSAGAIALVGPVPDDSDIARTLADMGCVSVAATSRILSGNYISKRRAIDDGVPIALASGYHHKHVSSMNPQFQMFMACHHLGMTAEEAIVATTYNAAFSLRLSHVTGSLAPGKSADICLMDLDDYRELPRRAGHHDAALVMRAGKIVYRRPHLAFE